MWLAWGVTILLVGFDAAAIQVNRLALSRLNLTGYERLKTWEWVGVGIVLWVAAVPVYAIKRNALWHLAQQTEEAGSFASAAELKAARKARAWPAQEQRARTKRSVNEALNLIGCLFAFYLLVMASSLSATNPSTSNLTSSDPGAGGALLAGLGFNVASPTCAATSNIDQGGHVNWNFCDLRGNRIGWTFPVQDYQQYQGLPHPQDPVVLRTGQGTRFAVNDVRPYVTPQMFDNTISDLTTGRTAAEFVQEAFNVKQSFITYQTSFLDDQSKYQYAAETMTQRTGFCGYTTILLLSLLQAGNAYAHYGMSFEAVYAEMNAGGTGLVSPPTLANHALVGVTFADGSRAFLESTAKQLTTWPKVDGWFMPVQAYTPSGTVAPRSTSTTTSPPVAMLVYQNQKASFAAGTRWAAPISLQQAYQVHYDTAYQGSGTYDVCLVQDGNKDAWQGATSGGWACHAGVNSQSDDATLQAGSYDLEFLCDNSFVRCNLQFTVTITPT
jgi:hypothetical protein